MPKRAKPAFVSITITCPVMDIEATTEADGCSWWSTSHDCDMCGSHGETTVTATCSACGAEHEVVLTSW